MEDLRYNPEKLFRSEFPEDILKALSEAMVKAYAESFNYCKDNFDRAQFHDLLPHHKRVTIERYILACTKRFPQVEAYSLPNAVKNCYHVLVRCGHAILTISAVKSPQQMVREAIFRRQYARSIQQNLWPELDVLPDLSENLYGVLLHGPNKVEPKKPSFMIIQFPDKDLENYLYGSIDLLHMVNDKQVEDIKKPTPRKKVIEIKEENES